MMVAKYYSIYKLLKESIEEGVYPKGELIPSENALAEKFCCSRNTIRRALVELAFEGYVQSMRGRGVRVVWQKGEEYDSYGRIESFTEASKRAGRAVRTEVPMFIEITVDNVLAAKTSFEPGTEVYYILRVRYVDGRAFELDHNYFHKDLVNDLTQEIASGSIYDYIENELHNSIATTRRVITVELATEWDKKYLHLGDYNCVAAVNNYTFDADGRMFEFTQQRHNPEFFSFTERAQRTREGG